MDRDRVDAWVSEVDDLLAGQRDDPMVSSDAMRWSPLPPTPMTLPPIRLHLRIDAEAYVRVWRQVESGLAEVARRVNRALEDFHLGRSQAVAPDAFAFRVDDERYRSLIQALRTRDTGPRVEPYRRRGLR